ncbi:hypothetical protein LPJ66_002057 [Kickxella alabastrina]|uniref:Uncharacterized protein n=1 Tax=Kickxella alabastrina TaxID=61397 RepID=A0ACC1IRH4_9FUNG|nr:hypothetical protein LPJ66_002057 [Kickxella alabastrina]
MGSLAPAEGTLCEQKLADAYDAVANIDRLVEKAYEAHTVLFKIFGDITGVSSIRKDKSIAEATHTDISNSLDALRTMVGAISQQQETLERLEKKPREKLISDDVRQLLAEYSPYVRLLTEQGGVRATDEAIDGAVRDLDMSAMRLQIGDFGESLAEDALDRRIVVLQERHPQLHIEKHTVAERTRLLVVRIPTIIQMSINLKQVEGNGEFEVNSIHVISDDEEGPFSRFRVFNRIAHDSNIIWFSIAGFSVEHRLTKVVQWFALFDNLFSATCSVCAQHLQMDPRTSQYLPPLWRDIDIKSTGPNKAFHYACLESA